MIHSTVIMLRFGYLLTFSLLLHFLLYGVVLQAPSYSSTADLTNVELVEYAESSTQKPAHQPIVPNSTNQEPSKINTPAQFLAEKNQRFEKETKAKNFGAFKNATPQMAADSQKQPEREQKKLQDEDDIPEFARAIQRHTTSAQTGTSSVPFDLPQDIEYGSATNLNADSHIYASFYNRIIELFYIRWSQNLDYIWDRLSKEVKQQLSGRDWITEVEVWLTADGLYYKGIITKKSGFPPFDSAGLQAFKDAKFFPNPPRAKVESDGFVRLRYRISVRIR